MKSIILKYSILILSTLTLIISCEKNEEAEIITISGRIINSSEEGISDVTISIPQFEIRERSSSSGNFSIQIPKGELTDNTIIYVKYEKEGYFTLDKHYSISSKQITVQMRSFKDEAFLIVDDQERKIPSTEGSFSIPISSNVNYEITDIDEDWIKVSIADYSIHLQYAENETFEERSTTIGIKGEYGLSREISITQAAGPALRVIDYIERDNTTSFLTTAPFVTFNREIEILSIESSYKNLNLNYKLSADKKTIAFPDLKIPPLGTVDVTYVVMATDSVIVKDSFDLKVYEKAIDSDSGNGRKIIFTKDGKSVWIQTSNYRTSSLIQYSSTDLSVMNTINWKNDLYSDSFYNYFNNTLLVAQNNYLDENDLYFGKLDTYDAANGKFINELDLRTYLNEDRAILNVSFGHNGFGLMNVSGLGPKKLFYIDAANNYESGLFSDHPMFYDPHHPNEYLSRYMESCNNGKSIVLLDHNSIKNVFAISTETKNIKRYSVNAEYYSANYSYPGIILGSPYYKRVSYLDVDTGDETTVNTNNADWDAVFLSSDNLLPTILTSGLAMINFHSKEEVKFEKQGIIHSFASSNNGKLVLIGYEKKLYLFNSEIFTRYQHKLQQTP